MVQIYQEAPSFLARLSKGLAAGAIEGGHQGLKLHQHNLAERLKGEQAKLKEIEKLTKAGPSFLKEYGSGIESADFKTKLRDKATELLQSGKAGNHDVAIQMAYDDVLKEQRAAALRGDATRETGKPSNRFDLKAQAKEGFEDLYGAGAKMAGGLANIAQMPLTALKELGKGGRKLIYQAAGIPQEEINRREAQLAEDIRAGEEVTGIISPLQGTTFGEGLEKATKGRSVPQDAAQKVISQGFGFGPAGIVGALAGQTAEELGLPEPLQAVADVSAFILSHKLNRKVPQFKAGNAVIKKAENVAAKTGEKAEEVIARAQAESGADLKKAAAGDKVEINKLKNAISTTPPKVAEKVTAAEKTIYNKKAAMKQREAFGAKLPESPLEEHFNINERAAKKEASKLPETIAKEAELKARLEPIEDQAWKDYQSARERLKRLEKDIKTVPESQRERVNALVKLQEREVAQTLEKVKDLQYELKYSRPRPTAEQIDAQIEKSVSEFKAEAANPTPEGQKGIQRQLDLDEKYVQRAEKLIERGELPGEWRPDTHVKMKQKYIEGYQEAIKQQKELLKELRGLKDAESLAKIREGRQFIEHLENRLKRLKADVVNQTDKIKVMSALEKPSGAFYKQQLKGLKKDIAAFQQDFFHHIQKNKTPLQQKVENLGHKKIAERISVAEKDAIRMEETIKNPTKENIKETAEELGVREETLGEHLRNARGETAEVKEEIKTGKVSPKAESKYFRKLKNFAAYAGAGAAVGAFSGLWEEVFGTKPSYNWMRLLSAVVGVGSFGATNPGYTLVRDAFESGMIERLKEIRDNPIEFHEYTQKIREKYGEAKVKRLLKKVRELDTA